MGESEIRLSRERMETRDRVCGRRLEEPEQRRPLPKINLVQHAFVN